MAPRCWRDCAPALAAPIVETGDEAHLPLGPEHEVRLVREDGLWRVDNRPSDRG